MNEMWFGLIVIGVFALILLFMDIKDRRRARRQRELLRKSLCVAGRVRRIDRLWGVRPACYELIAEFEHQGRTYCAMERCSREPGYGAGDAVKVCYA